jgi:glycosyltransferase involved in cell wall biosynthesis
MPSNNEPFGRVALEGALAGCPLLLHRAAGLRETPVPDFCFVDGLSPDVWERRLVEFLTAGEAGALSMVREIRESAEGYDPGWDAFLAQLTAMLRIDHQSARC